jgi:Tfp pilus assembly protein PilN
MIKINLLGAAAPPTPGPAAPPTRAFQVVTFVGALVVCLAIVGVFYKFWSSQVAELEQDLKRQQDREKELASVRAQNAVYLQHLNELERRINTIQTLQASRVGPVEQMTALGDVANQTSDVYLYTVAPQGERLAVRGQSGSVQSMATFLSALQHSGAFTDVQLRQFYEDDQQSRLTYKFLLDCLYKPPAPAGATAQPAAPAGTTTSAQRAGM